MLIRHQGLDVTALDSVEAERCQHRLVVESVQIHRLVSFSGVSILVPGRDAKGITLLPLDALALDLAVSFAGYDMVD